MSLTSSSRLALGLSNCRDLGSLESAVRQAASVGVHRVFVAEDVGCRDVFQLGAALGARDLGLQQVTVSVTNPYLRSPDVLAACALTLSQLLAAQLRVGFGSSSREIISGQLGLDYGRPVKVVREAVSAFSRLVTADEGRNGGRIPIMIAAMGPKMLRLAGEIADTVILNTGTTPRFVRWAVDQMGVGAARVGRSVLDIEIAVWVPMYIGEDSYPARLARARRWAASMLSTPLQGELLLEHAGLDSTFLTKLRSLYQAYPHRGDQDAGAGVIPDRVAETLAVIGTPGEAWSRVNQFFDAGVQTVVTGPSSVKRLSRSTSPQ